MRTNNYYEAREKAKLMNEVNIYVLVSRIEHLLSQVNFVYSFKDNAVRKWLYQTPEQILTKASNGASDFGNKFGQPLICGSLLTFRESCM